MQVLFVIGSVIGLLLHLTVYYAISRNYGMDAMWWFNYGVLYTYAFSLLAKK